MTTLQEAARKSFEAWKKTGSCFYLSRNNAPGSDLDGYQDAYTQGQWVAWQAALAQQDDSLQAKYLKSELAHALAQQGEQQPVCAGCGIPAGDVHMSTCKSGKWPSRVSNGDTAAPAPQAQEPLITVESSLRFRLEFEQQKSADLLDEVRELKGRIAKLTAPQPVAQPMTDDEYERMTTNGAAAWAGVDPQELRTGLAPLTDDQIWFLWASENGLEDCDMCKQDDFKKVFRYVENACGIKGAK